MSTLTLTSPSGVFEFAEPCYVKTCDRTADQLTGGGPMCRRCYVKMNIAILLSDMAQYIDAGWAPARLVENSRASLIRYERELAELDPSVPSKMDRFNEYAVIIADLQLERND